jgi:hypothetical protein
MARGPEIGNAFSHAVICAGYDRSDPAGPYRVMLNSWGTASGRRPRGTFRMRMNLDHDRPVYLQQPDSAAIAFEALAVEVAPIRPPEL